MKTSSAENDGSRPSLLRLSWLFFRVGNQTWGSGGTTVVLLSREMDETRWLDRKRSEFYYALARVVPGTNVLAFVAGVSHAIHGWAGVAAALLAYTIPASLVIVLLTMAYQRWQEHPVGGEFILSSMSAIAGIIVAGAVLLLRTRFGPPERVRTLTLVLGALLLSQFVAPLMVLAMAGVVGWFWPDTDGPSR